MSAGTWLEQGAAYRADETCGGGAILKKLPGRDNRLPTVTCSQEIFDLFRHHKKYGRESISAGIERLIRGAPDAGPWRQSSKRDCRVEQLPAGAGDRKNAQIQADFIHMGQSGIVTGTPLDQGGVYLANEAWAGGALLTKLAGSDTRMPAVTCSQEVFDLFRRYKKHGNESISQAIERLIREAPDVR